jgi:hypothetical protein
MWLQPPHRRRFRVVGGRWCIIVPMRPDGEIVIREDGTIAAGNDVAGDLLAEHKGRYRVAPGPPGTLLLERIDAAPEKRARVLAMGEIVGKMTVIEVIGMITSNGWRGELTILEAQCTRRLIFDQGALKAGHSDAPSERLGEVMVSLGVISPDQLARCVLSASATRRFGEIAIEMGFIDQKVLFEMLQRQAERIFQNALLAASGRYVFTLAAEDTEAPTTTLHLPVQAMLFESVQRIDEMAYFRERIPSGDVRPVLTDGAARVTLGESLRPVAGLADGKHSILDIGRELRLDEFQVTKRVMQLLQIGCVELKERQNLTRESVERIVRQLNEMLREIRDTVERHDGSKAKKQMLLTLQAWVKEADVASCFGPSMKLDGDLSADSVLRQLQIVQVDHPLEELHRAAHELASFAMFCVSPSLPREAERALSKWVNQRLSRMRL